MNQTAFNRYLRQMEDIRKLSSPQLIWTDQAETYSSRLRGNFRKIGELAGKNREILDAMVFPLTESDELLDETTVEQVQNFADELVNSHSEENLDLAIMALLSDRLLEDAERKGDENYLIAQRDSQLLKAIQFLYMTGRIFINLSISEQIREQGSKNAEALMTYMDRERFCRLTDDSKKIVLQNMRDRTLLYGSVSGITADEAHRWVKALDEAMAVYEDPSYRENAPHFDWNYATFRLLDHYGVILDYLYYEKPYEEDIRTIIRCLEKQLKMWDEAPNRWAKQTTHDFILLSYYQAQFLGGELSLEEYREKLLEIYENRNRQTYDFDNVYVNIKSPFNYILTFDPENMSEADKAQLHRFYRGVCAYAFHMPNAGTLGELLEYLTPLLRYFIEVPGDITFEQMGLQMLAALHPPTYVHSLTVANISRRLCNHLLDRDPALFVGVCGCKTPEEVAERREDILTYTYHAALCHDFGKIPLIDTIFVYGRKLLDSEFNIIRQHPELGAALLEKHASTKNYADVAKGHHRWFNNEGGYPASFDTAKSPVKTIIDIVTVADCLDAATDTIGRSYSKGKSLEDFAKELKEGSGTRYAPFMADLFEDETVREDLAWMLDQGRQNNYRNTYLLLRGVQEREEQSRAVKGNAAEKTEMRANTSAGEENPMGEASYIEVRTYRQGDLIFKEGTESDCMYEVKQGRVGIYKNYGTEEQELLTELAAEDVFGEMGMVEGVPRSASAVAMEERTEVARITWPILGNYFKTRPSRVVQIMQQTSDRLRRTTKMQTDAVQVIRQALDVARTTENLGEIRWLLSNYLKENG
ncbi:MAG: cyclic nucleotide-binding domain-containing protein [Lachnospiraceae bacterium]|nr:cyclic nucleotide-binding domain-containing protein [Lachnospiraceae bacterium]